MPGFPFLFVDTKQKRRKIPFVPENLKNLSPPSLPETYSQEEHGWAKKSLFTPFLKIRKWVLLLLVLLMAGGFFLKKDLLFSPIQKPLSHFKGHYPDFIGRKKYLDLLYKDLLAGKSPKEFRQSVQMKLLWGKGGFGKSELAIEFANRYFSKFSLIWTFWCDRQEHIEQGYRLLAEELGIPHKLESLENVRQQVHLYLENTRYDRPWLLIFDNVEEKLASFPQRGGVILVTSQKKVLGPEFLLEVEPFSKEESLLLLEKITGEKQGKEMEQLVEDLEGIPLLINYAANYIRTTPGCSIKEYQKLFSSHLLEKEEAPWKEVDNTQGYFKSLMTSWQFPLKSLEKEDPLALKWLFVCSYLYPEHIREDWVNTWLNQELSREDPSLQIKSKEILKSLQSYGIIRYDQKTKTFSLHRFFQHMIRESRKEKMQEDLPQAIALLAKYAKEYNYANSSSWQQGEAWYLHASEVKRFLSFYFLHFPGIDTTLQKAIFYEGIARWCAYNDRNIEALDSAQKALGLRKLVIPEDTLEIGVLYESIGRSLRKLRRYEESIAACDQALKIHSQYRNNNPLPYSLALGAKGLTLYKQGKYEEAIKYHEEALIIRRQTLGEISIEVGHSLNNIGICLREIGKYKEALKLFDQSMKVYEKTCGIKHPLYATPLSNKAKTICYQGHYRTALKFFFQAFSIHSSNSPVFNGYDMLGVGECYLKLKKFKKARSFFKKAIQNDSSNNTKSVSPFVESYNGIGWSYLKEKRVKKALKYLVLQLEVGAKEYKNSPKMIAILTDFKQALNELKALGAPIQEPAEIASKICEDLLGKEHALTIDFVQLQALNN